MYHLVLLNYGMDQELIQVTLERGNPYEIRDSHYGTSSIFRIRMGQEHTQVSKLGRHTEEGIGKKGSIKEWRKRDFDVFDNSGLEKQSKAAVKYY